MLKKYFCIAFFAFIALSCAGCLPQPPQIESRSDDPIVSVASDDAEMNAIIAEARATADEFTAALESPKESQRDFNVKYPFDTDFGAAAEIEHIWIGEIEKTDRGYSGIILNDPYYVKDLKYGDRVDFDMSKISDWKYVADNTLVGGRSIIYLIEKSAPEDRANILKMLDYKIPGY